MGSLDLKIGSHWKEIRKELFSKEEIHKSDESVASIRNKIEEKKKEQQKRLEMSISINSD